MLRYIKLLDQTIPIWEIIVVFLALLMIALVLVLWWAFGYNLVLVPVAAGVLYPFDFAPDFLRQLHPILAALAMAMSSISVVTNSLRLSRVRVE